MVICALVNASYNQPKVYFRDLHCFAYPFSLLLPYCNQHYSLQQQQQHNCQESWQTALTLARQRGKVKLIEWKQQQLRCFSVSVSLCCIAIVCLYSLNSVIITSAPWKTCWVAHVQIIEVCTVTTHVTPKLSHGLS